MAIKDITGMRFGRLVVIEPTNERKKGAVLWVCKCDCGNETVVNGSNLRRGDTKSCGCLHKDYIKELGRVRRKHFGCKCYDSDKHFAKGYCKNCYEKTRRKRLFVEDDLFDDWRSTLCNELGATPAELKQFGL